MSRSTGQEFERRSSRVLVSLSLSVSGHRSDGAPVAGTAETVIVNRHGARIRSAVPLEPRMHLRVSLLTPYKWRAAKVVWRDPRQNEYGIELYRPENFWGIRFPPEDWESNLPPVVVAKERPNPLIKSSVVQDRRHNEIRIPRGGVTVTLRGEAPSAIPFQEQGLLVPVGDLYGAISVAPLAGLSSKVSVIFDKDLVEGAAVAAIAYGHDTTRCRIWLQFARPLRSV
jgi:hypothetical protein